MKYNLYKGNRIYYKQKDVKRHIAKEFYQDVIKELLKNIKLKSM